MKNKNKVLAGILAVLILTVIISAINFYKKNTFEEVNNNQTQETERITQNNTPQVEFTKRYLFTNNLGTISFDGIINEVSDCSDWSAKLIRFKKHENLEELNEETLKELTNMIPLPCDAIELSKLGTEEFPTEEGIYRAVLKVSDKSGNFSLEEIYIIYDTTGARIDDTPDKTVYVEQTDLDKEPEIDKSDYIIIDNVDGKITDENIQCELEIRDVNKREWLVHVSYTDRAGNESKAEFLIIVKEKENETASNSVPNNPTSNTITDEENANSISPSEQKVIDAGYGNVVRLDSGDYAILTHGDCTINGQNGGEYLINYLENMGLRAQNGVGGCWISVENDWYWIIARNVQPIVTPDDNKFWD